MNDEARPAIPAEIRRRVLVEAGHRCAISTCRYIEVEIHHIVPWQTCKAHEYENLIALCPNCHNRADRGEIDRKALRLYKANLRYTHDRFSQFEVDFLFEACTLAPEHALQWPPYLMLMIKRLLDANFVVRHAQPGGVFIGGMQSNPDYIQATPAGRDYVQSLGLHLLDERRC